MWLHTIALLLTADTYLPAALRRMREGLRMGSTYSCHVKSRETRSEGPAPNCSIRMGVGGLAEPLMKWPMHKFAQCSNP